MMRVTGVLNSRDDLVRLARELADAGFFDVTWYAPHDVEELAGLPSTDAPIARWTLAGGLCGMMLALCVEWWSSAHAYPVNIGGRPLLAIPAWIPVGFEGTILGAGLATLAAFLWQLRLPDLAQPIDAAPGFDRVPVDAFWVSVAPGTDSITALERWLGEHGADNVQRVNA